MTDESRGVSVGRKCSVCQHPERHEIERALVARTASFRAISRQFGASKDALNRHPREHLPQMLSLAYQAEEMADADKLLSGLRKLHADTLEMLERARGTGDLRVALFAVEKARKNLELMFETEGRLSRAPTFNVHVHPAWVEIKAVLGAALGPFPAARFAVVRALEEHAKRQNPALEAGPDEADGRRG